MKKINFIKPNIRFFSRTVPELGVLIQYDYSEASTREELFALFHKWMDRAEDNEGTVRGKFYKSCSKCLYSILTGQSFESKINIDG